MKEDNKLKPVNVDREIAKKKERDIQQSSGHISDIMDDIMSDDKKDYRAGGGKKPRKK